MARYMYTEGASRLPSRDFPPPILFLICASNSLRCVMSKQHYRIRFLNMDPEVRPLYLKSRRTSFSPSYGERDVYRDAIIASFTAKREYGDRKLDR